MIIALSTGFTKKIVEFFYVFFVPNNAPIDHRIVIDMILWFNSRIKS